jgi:solute carrier family 25 carnitine/acylcarnitine transporter 20/29
VPRSIADAVFYGWLAGCAYGTTAILIGQPFDTIKTRMQVEKSFDTLSAKASVRKTFELEGFKGFYRGAVPVLFGSMFYRALQFGAFYGALHKTEGMSSLDVVLPMTSETTLRTVFCGVCGATFRAVFETPFEYIKVRAFFVTKTLHLP